MGTTNLSEAEKIALSWLVNGNIPKRIDRIAGNRLIVKVNYRFHMVYIHFVGTHAGYSKIDTEPDTEEEAELELLVTLVEIYEKDHFPISNLFALEAIKSRMYQMNLAPKDLIQYIGGKSKVLEVLSEKRTLSLNMIRRLNEGLGIPAEVLIQPYGNEAKEIA